MAKRTTGASGIKQHDESPAAEHLQSVNERSLLILRLVCRLSRTFPDSADVTGVVDQLSIEDERAWSWICNLGLIQGEPDHAALTTFGKHAIEKASASAGFTEILEGSDRLCDPEKKHASAVLTLLRASFELGGTLED